MTCLNIVLTFPKVTRIICHPLSPIKKSHEISQNRQVRGHWFCREFLLLSLMYNAELVRLWHQINQWSVRWRIITLIGLDSMSKVHHKDCLGISQKYRWNINTRLGEAAKQSPNSVTVVWPKCLSHPVRQPLHRQSWVNADYHLMIFSWRTKRLRLIMVVSQGQTSCPNYCDRVRQLFSGFT